MTTIDVEKVRAALLDPAWQPGVGLRLRRLRRLHRRLRRIIRVGRLRPRQGPHRPARDHGPVVTTVLFCLQLAVVNAIAVFLGHDVTGYDVPAQVAR